MKILNLMVPVNYRVENARIGAFFPTLLSLVSKVMNGPHWDENQQELSALVPLPLKLNACTAPRCMLDFTKRRINITEVHGMTGLITWEWINPEMNETRGGVGKGFYHFHYNATGDLIFDETKHKWLPNGTLEGHAPFRGQIFHAEWALDTSRAVLNQIHRSIVVPDFWKPLKEEESIFMERSD